MQVLLHILYNNIIPLSLMIGIGATLQRIFHLDIKTLSKLNFYVFSPGIAFLMLYESSISLFMLLDVVLFFSIFFILLFLVAEITVRIRKFEGGMRSAMRNSVLFYNSGNYAIPLNQLVFVNDPLTLSVQIIVMLFQNLIPNTYGIYSVNAHKSQLKDTLKIIMGMPVIYLIPLAVFMRFLDIPLPDPIYTSLRYVRDGFIATALITLGVQLGSMKWSAFRYGDVLLANMLRLCIGPLLGFLTIRMLGLEGPIAQALFLSCSVPTSLSSVLLAVEFDNEPEFASQVVFMSTLLSTLTVTVVIYLMPYI
jgi:malate permease and related proteins